MLVKATPPQKLKVETPKQKQRRLMFRVARSTLISIGIINMIIGGMGMCLFDTDPDNILFEKLPKHCQCGVITWKISEYVQSCFQLILGTTLICVLMTSVGNRFLAGKCWIMYGISGLVLSAIKFLYFYIKGCKLIKTSMFTLWLTFYMVELSCVAHYIIVFNKVIQKRKLKLKKKYLKSIDIVIIQNNDENQKEKK